MSNIKKVYIIDDDAVFTGELTEILASSGYIPVVENNPAAAVARIPQIKPDVLLLDLYMPHKNGFYVADEIIALGDKYSDLPVIAMTGHYNPYLEVALPSFRIKRCLKKPFSPLDLIAVIEGL